MCSIARCVLLLVTLSNHSLAFSNPKSTTTEYVLDKAHSSVSFEIAHLAIMSVDGSFKSFDGSFWFNPDGMNQTAAKTFRVEAVVDVASIDTGVDKRDNHLRSPDFFEAKKFSKMTFKSTAVKVVSPKILEVTGDLTIKNTTKPVVFKTIFKGKAVAYDKQRVGFAAETVINRKHFGLNWNDVVEAGPVVGDEVTITLKIQGIRKSDM